MISMITAVASNNVIGINNKLPWHIPDDLRKFKEVTTGKVVIMGRNTYASLNRPNGLPNRHNIVLSNEPDRCDDMYGNKLTNVEFMTFDELISNISDDDPDEYVVIGGSMIYKLFMPYITRMYMSVVNGEYEGDAYFPMDEFRETEWDRVSVEEYPDFEFLTLEKIK